MSEVITVCAKGAENEKAISVVTERMENIFKHQDERMDKLEEKVDSLDTKVGGIQKQINKLSTRITIILIIGLVVISMLNPNVQDLVMTIFRKLGGI